MYSLRNRIALFAAAGFALVSNVFAATYVVPEDRVLVKQSDAIVVATVTGSTSRYSEAHGIETVTTVRVEERIKGTIASETLSITEPGGAYGDVTRVFSGSPSFVPGERALLLLRQRPDGEWAVQDLSLGKFGFARDARGESILVRSEISGWDSQLRPYVERARSAEGFLRYVRDVVNGLQPAPEYFVASMPVASATAAHDGNAAANVTVSSFTAASYTKGGRRPGFPSTITYGRGPTQEAGAPALGDTAINAAMSAWSNISGADIKIAYNSSLVRSDTGLQPSSGDSKNTIQFERDLSWAGVGPFNCTPSSYSGVLGIGGFFTSGTHSGPNGESFGTITEGDVEMNQGIANCTLLFNSKDFNTAVAHEVGHSIGFRHADQDPNGGACTASIECSSAAIMKAFITQGINAAPQAWDQHAAQAVYPGAVVCTAPSINTQPASTSISSGNSTQLSVGASGTATLTYQWYIGASGNTSTPINGATNSTVNVSPSSTTSYWVRVTNSCGNADSNAATVTVSAGCTAPSINTQPASTSITVGNSTQLSVSASGSATLSYQWYVGASGNTTSPVTAANNSTLTVSPSNTTSYWVKVTNSCGSVDSAAATVTVNPVGCTSPQIGSIGAVPSQISAGQTSTLSVTATGSATLTYQWYQGASGNTSTPLGTLSTQNVTPAVTTQYWVKVTNSCGNVSSNAVTVTVGSQQCGPATIVNQPQDQTIVSGNAATLTVGFTGTNVSVIWYQGAVGNTSQVVGTGQTINTQPLTQTTTFWAALSNACGNAQTRQVTVTISASCTPPSIVGVTATPSTVSQGQSTNLNVDATGTSLSYQWYTGAAGDTSNPIANANTAAISVSPAATTSYWVRVTSGCGAQPANSSAVVVTVSACSVPTVNPIQAPEIVAVGTSATLTISANGSGTLHYQWYEGANGDTSKPVGTDSATFTSAPLSQDKVYWVRVSNSCGAADAAAVSVVVKATRRRVSRH